MTTTSGVSPHSVRGRAVIVVAGRHGCPEHKATWIMHSCGRFKLPLAVGLALFDHESDFRGVFGHDPTRSCPRRWMGKHVTRFRYLFYKARRRMGLGMQGVREGQLTWFETQDYADRLGGCWRGEINVRVAVETIAARIREFGYVKGIERYNGSGPAAVRYSIELRAEARVYRQEIKAEMARVAAREGLREALR